MSPSHSKIKMRNSSPKSTLRRPKSLLMELSCVSFASHLLTAKLFPECEGDMMCHRHQQPHISMTFSWNTGRCPIGEKRLVSLSVNRLGVYSVPSRTQVLALEKPTTAAKFRVWSRKRFIPCGHMRRGSRDMLMAYWAGFLPWPDRFWIWADWLWTLGAWGTEHLGLL